jgi:uncharacterized protein (TIGR02246 family)
MRLRFLSSGEAQSTSLTGHIARLDAGMASGADVPYKEVLTMLKRTAVSAVLIALSGCASMHKSDQGVQQGMTAFKEAFNRRDAAALAMVYTEDAKLMPYNVPMISGRGPIQSFWQTGFNRGIANIEKTPIEVQRLGGTAIEMSRYVVTVGDRKVQGKDMLVWRREGDGKWRIAADIWNNDQP